MTIEKFWRWELGRTRFSTRSKLPALQLLTFSRLGLGRKYRVHPNFEESQEFNAFWELGIGNWELGKEYFCKYGMLPEISFEMTEGIYAFSDLYQVAIKDQNKNKSAKNAKQAKSMVLRL